MNDGMDKLASVLLDDDEILEVDPREQLLNEINDMENEVAQVQTGIQQVKTKGDPVKNGEFFVEMGDLTARATAVLDACKEDIERSSLLDAELISAYAALIKATRDIIGDYLTIYRDRQNHLNKLEIEERKQEYRKEILIMKDNLDKSIEDNTGQQKIFVQEAVIAYLNKKEKAEREDT